MIFLQLFLSFLQVGMFSFGGGYAAMPLIQEQIVTQHGWLTMSEFTDLITISQMTPGPIAVNSATFVGIKIAGIPAVGGCAGRDPAHRPPFWLHRGFGEKQGCIPGRLGPAARPGALPHQNASCRCSV